MLLPRLAIVDLETTGADPSCNSITEIAILITEGDVLIEQWVSLINPQKPIPVHIQEITGITDEMVKEAPLFGDVAEKVLSLLTGAVFVAHNARFDFNFLRMHFEQCGKLFHPDSLCTVKLSRALEPQFSRHGLDAIIERAGYPVVSRHRAWDDAMVVWTFLTDSVHKHETSYFQRAWARSFSGMNTVPRLPAGNLETLPNSAGVYVLYGASGSVLRLATARDLRSQVLGIFTGKNISAKTKRLAAQVQHVEIHRCAGDLDMALTELQLLRQHALQGEPPAYAWCWQSLQAGPVLTLKNMRDSQPEQWQSLFEEGTLPQEGALFGLFKGEREARAALRHIALQNRLCHTRIGLEHSMEPCQAFKLGKCQGVCAGQESVLKHDQRLLQALASLRIKPWPWPDTISIVENEKGSKTRAAHFFDHWCYLGSQREEVENIALKRGPSDCFDSEIYRLLLRWLSTTDNKEKVIVAKKQQTTPLTTL